VCARTLVNAAGPWALRVHTDVAGRPARHGLRLVQGSHVVVPRLYPDDHAYILQQPDRRVVFVIPWERDFSLVGTTDVPVDRPGDAEPTPAEVDYLCAAIGRFLRDGPSPRDVVWSFAGTRALYDDGRADPSAVTRSDVLELELERGRAPLLSIYGGKLTTYRRLAERAFARLRPFHPGAGPDWTAHAPLPGGDLPGEAGEGPAPRFARLVAGLCAAHPALPAELVEVLARRHGTETGALLARAGDDGDDGDARDARAAGAGPAAAGAAHAAAAGARADGALGRHFGGRLHEREAAWCVEHEWAREADDLLWRRTREGLRVDARGRAALEAWLRGRLSPP
jgi:glycerol-3-phosphate dehydrogenase